MASKRTLGRLLLSFGAAVALTRADVWYKKQRDKKAKKGYIVTNSEEDIIIIGIEV
jgi:hypothetical protein